tara:strand:- start:5560 stop:6132 length:573 start_codon:yes stop_codon:yes gene_type:complete
MLNHKKDPTKKDLQLEELLRFKRAERPDEAYWNRFDRELHQRMLQTLVKKDPFHRQVLRAFAGKRFPVGLLTAATAAVALVAIGPFSQPQPSIYMEGSLAASTPQSAVSAPLGSADADAMNPTNAANAANVVEGVEFVDYTIESIGVGEETFQQDFGMDRMVAAELSQADYSFQEAAPRSGRTMLASLTF